MRVLPSTLLKAMSHLYQKVVEPSACVIDELQLENEWVLVIGLRRSDFQEALNDLKQKRLVVDRSHGAMKWIEFTYDGIEHLKNPPKNGVMQELRDWVTLKRANLRKLKPHQIGLADHRQRITDVSAQKS